MTAVVKIQDPGQGGLGWSRVSGKVFRNELFDNRFRHNSQIDWHSAKQSAN